jgi:hypothetical protein
MKKVVFIISLMVLFACQKQIDYQPQINILNSNISALQKSRDSLAAALAQSNNNLNTTNINVAVLSKSLDSIKVQLTSIGAQIATLNSQMTSANANIATLTSQIAALNQQFIDLLAKYNAIILQLAPSTLNSGLVAYYPFNGNANDSSSNSYNGVVFFGATLINDRNNITRSAYRFDGIKGTKIQTTFPGILGNNSRAISLWARSVRPFNSTSLLTWGTQTGGAGFGLSMSGRGEIRFFSVDNEGSSIQTAFSKIDDGNWHNYIVIYDNRIGNSILNVKIYIDGILYNNDESYNPQNINTIKGINMVIGEYSSAKSDWRTFQGDLDDIRIYNRVLTESEIKYLSSF